MNHQSCFVIDFDSTFIKVEAFDLLADIIAQKYPGKSSLKEQISCITKQAMEGAIPFRDSLQKRIELLSPYREDLMQLTEALKKNVSESFKRNKSFFVEKADRIYIVSNGFHCYIDPIVAAFGVKKENIFANTFVFDTHGKVIGFNRKAPLSKNMGKALLLKKLKLEGDVYVIGDGYTDYEIKKAGLANKFFAFTENIKRDNVLDKADHITPSLDEFLYLNKLNASVSYPKNRIKVLILDNISNTATQQLTEEGFDVAVFPAGIAEDTLSEKIKEISILCIRSKTQVTEKVLKNARCLMAIGAFCIGTNQIDLDTAQRKGIVVFNAPFSNTRSVVELALAEIILLMRNMPDRWIEMHRGKWNKSSKGSMEVRGKKLGIIGYGNIGSQLSVLAENVGMKVYYYDVEEKLSLGNAMPVKSMEKLLAIADVISLHVDGKKTNQHLIGRKEFENMKKGTILLNLSRGHIVDTDALKDAILDGTIAGCGIDVFPKEPLSDNEVFQSKLCGLPNTLLTPHIGGSTLEAQENIAQFVSKKLISYINTGNTQQSINFPNAAPPPLKNGHRLIHIHRNVPGVLAKINSTLARHKANIIGQYLQTNEQIGYVITDINKKYDSNFIQTMKRIKHTIKFRVLY